MNKPFWLVLTFLILPLGTQAACFNFEERVENALSWPEQIPIGAAEVSGKKTDQLFWAAAQGKARKPITLLLDALRSHNPTKSSRASKVEIRKQIDGHNDHHDQTHFEIRPFPLVRVEWNEDWVFNRIVGNEKYPKEILVAFEKTSGTGHIAHLCGQIELSRQADDTTFIKVYEEVQADRHDQNDTLSGVNKILTNLKNEKFE